MFGRRETHSEGDVSVEEQRRSSGEELPNGNSSRVFEPSLDLIAEVASRQRLRLRLGQLVETAFPWKETEKAGI
ncbi:hypothetical protein MPC4_150084 [Methylocella tundrae]|uniref:Uncharacterized protein n=1 Tax=Methylocella tundrae TaxID=227605 RepID=A0A8B6M5D0_METTU|nr:hypothetical protein MPC4_150084 [Methylocella tundrae]